MDYHDIAESIFDTADMVTKRKLTAEQRMMLTGAIAPWLDKYVQRARRLRRYIENVPCRCNAGCGELIECERCIVLSETTD